MRASIFVTVISYAVSECQNEKSAEKYLRFISMFLLEKKKTDEFSTTCKLTLVFCHEPVSKRVRTYYVVIYDMKNTNYVLYCHILAS